MSVMGVAVFFCARHQFRYFVVQKLVVDYKLAMRDVRTTSAFLVRYWLARVAVYSVMKRLLTQVP